MARYTSANRTAQSDPRKLHRIMISHSAFRNPQRVFETKRSPTEMRSERNVRTMRIAARAYRPRVAPTAYGRAIGLPSAWLIPQRAETPHFVGPRDRWPDSKIYDLSIVRAAPLDQVRRSSRSFPPRESRGDVVAPVRTPT